MKLKRKIKHIKNHNKEIPAGACYLEQQKKKNQRNKAMFCLLFLIKYEKDI